MKKQISETFAHFWNLEMKREPRSGWKDLDFKALVLHIALNMGNRGVVLGEPEIIASARSMAQELMDLISSRHKN